MNEDEYPHEPARCPCRCPVHHFMPCVGGSAAHETHRCVRCLPRFGGPKFKIGQKVTHASKSGVTHLVICGTHRMSIGWVYSCRREDDTEQHAAPFPETTLHGEQEPKTT